MLKKIILIMVGIIPTIINLHAQANWNFVGPYSNNNLNGQEFETSQMSHVITSPMAPSVIFATSVYGGLWKRSYEGFNQYVDPAWTNIDMSPTGLDQANAIAFKNSSEILVGNYHMIYENGDAYASRNLSYSNRVSIYNFITQTWSHLPLLPTGNNKCVINCIELHPLDQNIIYVGTTMGLFRYNGSAWSLIVPNTYIESVVFVDDAPSLNKICYISGSNLAGVFPNYSKPIGSYLLLKSNDPANINFQSFIITNEVNISDLADISDLKICKGNNGTIFGISDNVELGTLIYVASENNYQIFGAFHHMNVLKIKKNGNNYDCESLKNITANNEIGGYSKMSIAFDNINNCLLFGSVKFYGIKLSETHPWYPPFNQDFTVSTGSKMTDGSLHNDIHDINIDYNNKIWVACDGGIASGILLNPPSIYFNRQNNNLNVSLLNGFSGSEQDPNLYILGGQDITNTDIYDATIQRNRFTHSTWENDGGFIDKFDDNLMIFDSSSYSSSSCISLDKGATIYQKVFPYTSNNYAPFIPVNPDYEGKHNWTCQRTIQDPYRPNRIFQVGRSKKDIPGFDQFDMNEKKFIYKAGFGESSMPGTYVNKWGTVLYDMSFSPLTKNSLHFITTNISSSNDQIPSTIIKYIGPDIDDCWHNHNEYYSGSQPQWLNITPNYALFSSVGNAANIADADLGKVSFRKVETSPWNKDRIYIACNIDDDSTKLNATVKVLKYENDTWYNYSATGIPVNAHVYTMVMDHNSNDGLYLSTDKGVYFRDANMETWEPYFTGLPAISVTQMEINYKENTVRVGTYGRGIWKSQLQCPTQTNLNLSGVCTSNVYEANNITSNAYSHELFNNPTALRATNSVILNPGFRATPPTMTTNKFLVAYIHGCSSGSSTSPNMFRESSTQTIENLIDTLVDLDFKLYPNPSNGQFTLEKNTDEEVSIEVRDIQGKSLKSFKQKGTKLEIDLSNFKKGMYFVTLETSNKKSTSKIVIE